MITKTKFQGFAPLQDSELDIIAGGWGPSILATVIGADPKAVGASKTVNADPHAAIGGALDMVGGFDPSALLGAHVVDATAHAVDAATQAFDAAIHADAPAHPGTTSPATEVEHHTDVVTAALADPLHTAAQAQGEVSNAYSSIVAGLGAGFGASAATATAAAAAAAPSPDGEHHHHHHHHADKDND